MSICSYHTKDPSRCYAIQVKEPPAAAHGNSGVMMHWCMPDQQHCPIKDHLAVEQASPLTVLHDGTWTCRCAWTMQMQTAIRLSPNGPVSLLSTVISEEGCICAAFDTGRASLDTGRMRAAALQIQLHWSLRSSPV